MPSRIRRRDPDEEERIANLKNFADAVLSRARAVPEGSPLRFGREKVFLVAIDGKPTKTMARMLFEAHRERFLTLSRADLIPAMDPKLVRDSEIHHLNSAWHFVTAPPSQRDVRRRTRYR